ncbi:MAG: transcriptional regulator PpsR [Leptothrix sp. (in: b-proteobacteria)]
MSFSAPRKNVEPLDASEAAMLIEAAADIALVIDRRGVIQDVCVSMEDAPEGVGAEWIGQSWVDTVAIDSSAKVTQMLADPVGQASRRWRHVNHLLPNGQTLPVQYSLVRVGTKGRVIAFGRDLRSLSGLQQRLVDAQHALERDYWRLRQVETRYRVLFDVSNEAILIVDAASSKIVEANAAAVALLALPARRVAGAAFPSGLSAKGQRDVVALLARVRSQGPAEPCTVRAIDGKTELRFQVTLFSQDDAQFFLVHLRAGGAAAPLTSVPAASTRWISELVERAPDGFVVTDLEGRVLMANPAFTELTQLPTQDRVRGQLLDRWLGRPGVDLSVLLATLRQQGTVRLFATSVRGEQGAQAEVEISGVSLAEHEPPCLGFAIRHVGRRLGTEVPATKSAPRSVEQLTQLVGRMPLKDLVRESTDLIEQLCIEAALQLTQDNRASAAEMLGLSRQSLYVKLRRYGLGDLNADTGT